MNKIIYLIIGLIVLVGCTNESIPEYQDVGNVVSACNLNGTPTIFLYPVTDYLSEEPTFFENTTYEIMKDYQYLGQFKGDRFNNSFLNISVNNLLEMIVSAEDEDCFVLNEVVPYTVSCEPIQYITPRLRCAKKWFRFYAYNPKDEENLKENNIIKTSKDRIYVKLRIMSNERFKAIGCYYDWHFVEEMEIQSLHQRNVPRGIRENYGIDELFQMDDREDFDLILVFYLEEGMEFETNVTCTLFDYEFMIKDYNINYGIYRKYSDVGQPNPSFNFTIIKD